ncbi:MAG TPA: HD domain-containing phosphohydrolase [Dehalococcoidales bacterium]
MVTEIGQGRILIVDDEEVVRRTISKALTKKGYQCIEAGESLEVMNRIENNNPDLVILDIIMPGKSGRELLPEIVTCYPQMAVIMATAIIDPDTIIECMKAGAQDYVTKPFDLEEVVARVHTAMEIKRLERKFNEYHQHLEHKVEDHQREIRELFLSSIEALVYALEAKDQYTAGHARRVTSFAIAIGEEMGLSQDELEDLRWGALLHDVGKIAVDPAVQNRPGRLTSQEYQHMMTHAIVGAGIVKPVANKKMIEIIVYHHGRYDGTGFEQTVRGEELPLGARIVAVADSFDAMTSDRPYRSALSTEKAIIEIARNSGTQFDPQVVAAFLKIPVNKIMPVLEESKPTKKKDIDPQIL